MYSHIYSLNPKYNPFFASTLNPNLNTRKFRILLPILFKPNLHFFYFSRLNMELSLVEAQNPTNSQNFDLLINENYIKNLNQTIQNLLHEFKNGVSDTSLFVSNLYELLQARVNPPLEAIWVYSALSFHSSNLSNDDVLTRVSFVKDLFQLVSACSASCSASKSIALLAPVVLEVYHLVHALWTKEFSGKREKKAMREITCLIESILGYMNVCSEASNEENGDLVGTITSFADLVCVWMKEKGGGSEGVESFFPLVSEEIRRKLSESEEECDVSYLAGVVIVEAFLLKLCLKFRSGIPKQELEKDLMNWAVGSLTGFKSYYFFETLVRMLLEPTLPVTSLLNTEDEKLLRKVLYDAVILVDYSFLNMGSVIQPPAERMNSLILTKLIVTHEAVEYFRENGDLKRAISYLNAFSGSSLPLKLTRWVTSLIGTEEKESRPNGSSPKSLITWLLNLENRGIRMFDDSISKCHAKLVDVLKAEYEQLAGEAEDKKSDADLLFYVDNKGEGREEEEDRDDEDKEANEYMSAAYVAAAKTMKSADNDGRRKRKDRSSKKKKQIKFLKYNLDENSQSARENPLSDDDMEEKEQ